VWMWAALLAGAISGWIQELAGLDNGRGRKRRAVARLRRELITIPARLAHRGRDRLILHLPLHWPCATGSRASSTPLAARHRPAQPDRHRVDARHLAAPSGPTPATDPPRTDKPHNCQRPTIHDRKRSNDHHSLKTITHYWAVDRG